MPEWIWWAVPGIVIWILAEAAALRWLTGERDEHAKYGLAPLIFILWYVPDAMLGITGAAAAEGFLVVVGFPIAAIYLAMLLASEIAERRRNPQKSEVSLGQVLRG
ncbi:MAG TPA: hypothetical protein VFO34_11200 [Candidatus Acidoferrales bacterium]|nr:hypothetical protein [Candidatus Acidoferrales bacterium]